MRQRGLLRAFVGADATVSVSSGGKAFQLATVGFSRDGSIRVHWPYLKIELAMVAAIHLPDEREGPVHIDMKQGGRYTSQLVKFSHHVSGDARFSQTGKVRSDVRRMSFPLNGPIGRIFELFCFLPAGFASLIKLKKSRVYIDFAMPDGLPAGVRIRGEWRARRELRQYTVPKGPAGPVTHTLHRLSGKVSPIFIVAPPSDAHAVRDHVLVISIEEQPSLPDGIDRSTVIFRGGWDSHDLTFEELVRRGGRGLWQKNFLTAVYPVRSDEQAQRLLGSIDL